MIIEVDTVKGFQDYLPPESLKRRKIKDISEKWYKLYGFIPIETPEVEFDELMKSDALPSEEEDEAISDRFKLKDKGGRNLGLRYEFTFQLARILKQNPTLKLPFRRYQIGNVFRDEPIRLGRTRQFTQCDIDIIGDEKSSAEAECLVVMSSILKELEIEFEIRVNNRKLLDAIIESVEIQSKKQVLREIDKMDKLGEDNVKANLRKYADANQILTLFKILEKDLKFFKDNAFEGSQELIELTEQCKKYDLKLKLMPTLVRGFSYYTGNIFEIVIRGTNTALAGGGRYDNTVGKFLNKKIPAVGISFSLEALMGLCPDKINSMKTDPISKVQIISIQQDNEAIKMADKLRNSGITCTLLFDKTGKCLEYANAYSIPKVIFLGEDEIKKKKYKLRDMKSGKEKELSITEIIKTLKK